MQNADRENLAEWLLLLGGVGFFLMHQTWWAAVLAVVCVAFPLLLHRIGPRRY